jgi:phospholipid/cholesterol/gamma-HCH transport system substrate-binding protein
MRPNRSLEIGTGLFVLLGFAALFFLTTQLPGSGLAVGERGGFVVTAAFDNIGDLKAGAPVSMSGVNVGRVAAIRYDAAQYKAVVQLSIENQYDKIPDDSFASVQTTGLLGGKFIDLSPGGSETFLRNGGQITQTQPAIVLENLINQLFARMAGNSDEKSAATETEPQEKTP